MESQDKKLEKVAKRIFKQYPKIDVIHLTADGQGFTRENDAINHAKYLGKDKAVKTFNRNEPKEIEPTKETEPGKGTEVDIDVPLSKKEVDQGQATKEDGKEADAKKEDKETDKKGK